MSLSVTPQTKPVSSKGAKATERPQATAWPGGATAPQVLMLWAGRQPLSPNPDDQSDSQQQYSIGRTGLWSPHYPALAALSLKDHVQDVMLFPCPWGMLTHAGTRTHIFLVTLNNSVLNVNLSKIH